MSATAVQDEVEEVTDRPQCNIEWPLKRAWLDIWNLLCKEVDPAVICDFAGVLTSSLLFWRFWGR